MWNSQSGNQPFDLLRVALSRVEVQHFVFPEVVNSKRIPYELVIDLPKPRYERNIVARDEFGRIVHSEPPPMNF